MSNNEAVPLFEIDWTENDLEYVTESIRRGGYWANGPYVSDFEARIEEYLGVDKAIVVNSGTSALECALHAHDVGPGDEVVVPSFTFIATANAVERVGATPVFVDIERDTYGIDPASVRAAITEKTAAILPVHVYGAACQIEKLVDIARDHDLPLIEDAAEAFGGTYDGHMLGTFGDSAALSFCQNKIITTGEGGAVVTDDPEIATRVELARSHGRESAGYFSSADSGRYVGMGGNLRMSDITASLGCAQIERVEDLVAGRRRAAEQMNASFRKMAHVQPHISDSGRHVYQLYTVTFDEEVDREAVLGTLRNYGVASKRYWDPPAHLTRYYREKYGHDFGTHPVSEDVASRVLSLPIHPNVTDEEVDSIVSAVREGIESSVSRVQRLGRSYR